MKTIIVLFPTGERTQRMHVSACIETPVLCELLA